MDNHLEGSVVRTESLLADRDFFLTIQTSNGELNRTRVLSGAFEIAPRRGEYVELTGEYRNSQVFGEVFVSESGKTVLPKNSEALNHLFANYPLFSFLDRSQRQVLESASYSPLMEGLEENLKAICKGAVTPECALDLQQAWLQYRHEVGLMAATRGLKLRPAMLRTLVRGLPDAVARFEADPFSISALARWDALEQHASTRGLYREDGRRFVGAATAAFFSDGDRQVWVFNRPHLASQLQLLLGSKVDAEEAIRSALVSQALHASSDGTIQDRASQLLTSSARLRLNESGSARHLRQGQRNRKDAALVLAELEPDAVHVFPNHRLADAVDSRASTTFAELLSQPMDASPQKWPAVVLHGFDLLDPCSLNRLLFRIGKAKFTAVSKDASPRMPWWPDVPEAPTGRTNLAAPTEADSDLEVTAAEGDIFDEALFHHRKNSVASSAVIVCAHETNASRLNFALHEENIEYRAEQKLDTQTIEIFNKQKATSDEPVIWRKNGLKFGAVKGSCGRITGIGQRVFHEDYRDVGALTVELEERYEIEVPWSERDSLVLGYSVNASATIAHSWDCVIALIDDASQASTIISAAHNIALGRVIVVCNPEDIVLVEEVIREANEISRNHLGKEGGRSAAFDA